MRLIKSWAKSIKLAIFGESKPIRANRVANAVLQRLNPILADWALGQQCNPWALAIALVDYQGYQHSDLSWIDPWIDGTRELSVIAAIDRHAAIVDVEQRVMRAAKEEFTSDCSLKDLQLIVYNAVFEALGVSVPDDVQLYSFDEVERLVSKQLLDE